MMAASGLERADLGTAFSGFFEMSEFARVSGGYTPPMEAERIASIAGVLAAVFVVVLTLVLVVVQKKRQHRV